MPSTLINLAERLAAASQAGREQVARLRAADAELPELHRRMLEQVRHMADQPRPEAVEGLPPESPAELEAAHERIEALEQELQEAWRQVHEAQQASAVPAPVASDIDPLSESSWEAMKRRMLAESEEMPLDDGAALQRKLDEVEQFRVGRDEELQRLQEELEAARSQAESTASGEGLLTASLDLDSAIQQERENLLRLQEEWHEKLRQAEVEISVERARMARERTEMEERIRAVELELEHAQGHGGGKRDPSSGGGKWFARLGLLREE